MKPILCPIFYFLEDVESPSCQSSKVKCFLCPIVSLMGMNVGWMRDADLGKIAYLAHVDIAEQSEVFDDLESACRWAKENM